MTVNENINLKNCGELCYSNLKSICCENMQLARAYVPFQKPGSIYNPQTALGKGTLFPDLFSPYEKECC